MVAIAAAIEVNSSDEDSLDMYGRISTWHSTCPTKMAEALERASGALTPMVRMST